MAKMRAPRDVGQQMDDPVGIARVGDQLVEPQDFADVSAAPPHLRRALIKINERHLVQGSDRDDAALWREPLSGRLVRAMVQIAPTMKEFAWGVAQ
jgi:hypothetical protein